MGNYCSCQGDEKGKGPKGCSEKEIRCIIKIQSLVRMALARSRVRYLKRDLLSSQALRKFPPLELSRPSAVVSEPVVIGNHAFSAFSLPQEYVADS